MQDVSDDNFSLEHHNGAVFVALPDEEARFCLTFGGSSSDAGVTSVPRGWRLLGGEGLALPDNLNLMGSLLNYSKIGCLGKC